MSSMYIQRLSCNVFHGSDIFTTPN
uniref:Uncharacterized protein n=1 Tax=Anguilla anguilla TaxID=7936 RepID=A0A0E9RCY6_ANGAN